MKIHDCVVCGWVFLALASTGSTTFAAPQDTATPAAQAPAARHVRAADGGAKLRNLADRNGEVVLDAPSGTIMVVHSERSGWLEVEPATGMKVWVYGSYLEKTNTPGLAGINANSVRMRPLPSSDEKSFPLPMKLDRGERVHVIARQDPNRSLGEDWVQVWSPPGARAWVATAETKALAAGEDARAAWAAAQKNALASMSVVDVFGGAKVAAAPVVEKAKPAAKEAAAVKPDPAIHAAQDKFASAEKLLSTARASETPDYKAAKAAYEAVIAAAPQGALADTARARVEEIAIREEMARIKADTRNLEEERSGKLSDAEAKLREVQMRQDPLRGRYQARGWLERQERPGFPARFAVTWAGREVAEIACGSGRYELDAFVGCEIGVLGVTQRAAVPATDGGTGTPASVDATRIEVISARAER